MKSLRADGPDPLTVRIDGAVMNGNTRVLVLRRRGFDVETLSRKPYEP
ncbi:MAG: hypothetical protein ACYC9W_04325 [Candidatus Limnocylindria bacterium]